MDSPAHAVPPELHSDPVPRRRDLLRSLLLRLTGLVAGTGTTVLLARSLDVKDYGTWAALSTTATLLLQLAEFGTTGPAVVAVARRVESSHIVCVTILLWRFALGSALAAATIAVVAVLGGSSHLTATVALMTTVPLAAVTVLAVPDQAAGRGRTVALLPALGAVCSLVACTAAMLTDAGLTVTTVLYAAGTLVASLLTIGITDRGWMRTRPSRAVLRNGLMASWPLAVMGIAVTAYYRLDSVLVYAISGPVAAAHYGVAYRFLDVLQILPAVLLTPMLARLVPATSNLSERTNTVNAAVRVLLSLATVVVAVFFGFGPVMCRVLFGEAYSSAGLTAGLLSLAFLPICLGWLGATLATGADRTRAMAAWAWLVCGFSLTLQVPAIHLYGANGAAAVTVLTELVMGPVILARTCRAEEIRLRPAALGAPVLSLAVTAPLLLLPLAGLARGLLLVAAALLALIAFRAVHPEDVKMLVQGQAEGRP